LGHALSPQELIVRLTRKFFGAPGGRIRFGGTAACAEAPAAGGPSAEGWMTFAQGPFMPSEAVISAALNKVFQRSLAAPETRSGGFFRWQSKKIYCLMKWVSGQKSS